MDGAISAGYPLMELPKLLDIPLKASEEVVSINLETDLPDDPADLKTLLVEEGSDKEHWLTIATAYCNSGATEKGINLVEMALDTFENTDRAPLYTFLTWAHLKLAKEKGTTVEGRDHQLTQAEVQLKNAIGVDPTWIGNMLATIDLYYQRGHYDRALETSDLFVKSIHAEDRRKGVQSKPNSMFLLLRAKLLYQKKNYMASLRAFQELLVINPVMHPDPRIGIGLCFWQLKDYKIAISAWKRALQLNPADENAAVLVLLGDFHNSLTSSENDDNFVTNYVKALQDLDSLLAKDKENPVLLTLLQSYFYFKGDYNKVLDIYENKVSKLEVSIADTVLSESMFWCGRAHYALQDYRKAFSMFQQCLKRNEDNLLARFGFGQTQIKNKLVEESILTFENIYKNHEGIQELNYILGLLYAGKCLDLSSSKNLSRREMESFSEKSIQYLEKYVKLTNAKKNQVVISRSYLAISELYEAQNQYKQSLEYLLKAVQQYQDVEGDVIPIEMLNNLGCFYFINGDLEKANYYFGVVKTKTEADFNMTVYYNFARALEKQDPDASKEIYDQIISKHPGYLSARMRRLFFKVIEEQHPDLKEEMDKLLSENKSNLEVRSFYSWFLKNSHRGLKKSDNLETAHDKETLVKYDSHDFYALTSLGNLYCMIARETRGHSSKDQENSKQSYLKAVQLFQKVLQLDPFSIFAAQGIAIVFAESKRFGPALEILRKGRDSLDNEDVHLNMAHCLLEMHEYAKAIELYEFSLKRFGNVENRPKLLNLLGRAWYARATRERVLEFFQFALANAQKALEAERERPSPEKSAKFMASLKYNVALLHFQIAETLRRSNPKGRSLADIQSAQTGLETGLNILKELKEMGDFVIIPKEELEQRIQLGETTMKSTLERCVKEQEAFESEQAEKFEQARKLLEENEQREQERERQEKEASRIKLEKQKEEYRRLQDEAQKIIQEREEREAISESHVERSDLSDAEGEDGEGQDKKKKKRKPSNRKNKAGEKKRRKKNQDSQDGQAPPSPTEKEDDDGEVIRRGRGKKKQILSGEFVEDSDEEEAQQTGGSDDDGLF
ncbi:probable RNA polymerase-associated protein CTR9 [Zygosaccharomyces bailii]|nr:probable RNA polymerase-associated protein CTR9 [Zygosaccharomyces bailii]